MIIVIEVCLVVLGVISFVCLYDRQHSFVYIVCLLCLCEFYNIKYMYGTHSIIKYVVFV